MNAIVANSLKIASGHPESDSIQGDGVGYCGIFSNDSLSKGSPADFLASEFLRRQSDEERLTVFQEAFVLAGTRGNDEATATFLKNFHRFLSKPSCHLGRSGTYGREDYKHVYDASCAKGKRLFDVIHDAYWNFPLYGWKADGSFRRTQVNRMQKTKKQIFLFMAELWGGVNDNLGNNAFWFLCDVCNKEVVIQQATPLFAAENIKREKNSISNSEPQPKFYFEVPKEDVDAVLHAMRNRAPDGNRSGDKEIIRFWFRNMPQCQPECIRRHLGHAYVNVTDGLID